MMTVMIVTLVPSCLSSEQKRDELSVNTVRVSMIEKRDGETGCWYIWEEIGW
jgi:hypothetical protein